MILKLGHFFGATAGISIQRIWHQQKKALG